MNVRVLLFLGRLVACLSLFAIAPRGSSQVPVDDLVHGGTAGGMAAASSPARFEGGVLPVRIENLRCEYLTNPSTIDTARPRLSWTLASRERGQRQTAYQVIVASTSERLAQGEADLWDSGRVSSDETLHIEYDGQPLLSRRRAHWKVRVWDRDERVSRWSEPAWWGMGLLQSTDWQAQWIADPASLKHAALLRPHNGYHSALTNLAAAPQSVVLDLRQPFLLDGVRLFPARPYDWQPDTPGFLFPVRFTLEVAQREDFSDAHIVLDQTQSDASRPGTNAPLFRFPAVTARYARLNVTRLAERDAGNFAFALAELQLLDGEQNRALGAQVSAANAIESGGWARANLVDGVLGTVAPEAGHSALPATYFRKEFRLANPVRRAVVYASALGVYELRLNGERIGQPLLAPEWTSYRKRVQYQAYDVTPLIQPGQNAIGGIVAEGWYAGRLMAVGRFPYGDHPRFLLQLEVEFDSGRRQIIATDPSWRSTNEGPIRSSGIYDGEVYDARREWLGWDRADFDDGKWHLAQAFADGPTLVAQPNEPIRVTRELKPVALTEPAPGVHVFDLGQNMVGWCRIRVRGEPGKTIVLRHAEMLNDDGTLYRANLRGAPQVDQFIPRTSAEVVYEPRFTYHGFRYLEVSGLAAPPRIEDAVGQVFHSAAPEAGSFHCSDPALNQLMRNIVWTQRGNLMSTPNDCPQRDERFGWMGDIQAFAQTAIFNMDLAAFLTKFARDIRDDQADDGRFPDFAPHPGNPNAQFSGAPAWADAGVIVPWRAWQNYADRRLLAEHFDAARRWVDYVHQHNRGLIWASQRGNDYNDWLNGDWIRQDGWPSGGGSISNEVFATAFFAHSAELVSKMAGVLNRPAEASQYGRLASDIKAAFTERFVSEDGRIASDTQAAYGLALHFDLLPEPLRPKAAARLVSGIHLYGGHLSTGIQSTHRAMLELTRWGNADLAWQLLTNRTFPSWRYMIDNGATTIWERWDGYVKGRGFQDAGMNSFNHWAFGAVGEWMWRHMVGLNPDDAKPGWKHFIIRPRPGGGVTHAAGEYQSIRGSITSAWVVEGGRFSLRVSVPPGTIATVWLPAAEERLITEGDRKASEAAGVRYLRQEDGCALYELQSGAYAFEVRERSALKLSSPDGSPRLRP